jgi:hypothetical protein
MRITQKQLEQSLTVINNLTGGGYALNWAYGGVRMVDSKNRDVTPRTNKKEQYYLLDAFYEGFYAAKQVKS